MIPKFCRKSIRSKIWRGTSDAAGDSVEIPSTSTVGYELALNKVSLRKVQYLFHTAHIYRFTVQIVENKLYNILLGICLSKMMSLSWIASWDTTATISHLPQEVRVGRPQLCTLPICPSTQRMATSQDITHYLVGGGWSFTMKMLNRNSRVPEAPILLTKNCLFTPKLFFHTCFQSTMRQRKKQQ